MNGRSCDRIQGQSNRPDDPMLRCDHSTIRVLLHNMGGHRWPLWWTNGAGSITAVTEWVESASLVMAILASLVGPHGQSRQASLIKQLCKSNWQESLQQARVRQVYTVSRPCSHPWPRLVNSPDKDPGHSSHFFCKLVDVLSLEKQKLTPSKIHQ